MSTLTGQEWLTHPDPWARGYATMLKAASERNALKKREKARQREQRLQKIAPADAPRLDLAKHLQVRAPVAERDAASLIKSLHQAGGTPLMPRAPALRKVDAVPAHAAEPAADVGFDFERMTEGEAWAHATRAENEASADRAASFRQALAGQGLAIGGKR